MAPIRINDCWWHLQWPFCPKPSLQNDTLVPVMRLQIYYMLIVSSILTCRQCWYCGGVVFLLWLSAINAAVYCMRLCEDVVATRELPMPDFFFFDGNLEVYDFVFISCKRSVPKSDNDNWDYQNRKRNNLGYLFDFFPRFWTSNSWILGVW